MTLLLLETHPEKILVCDYKEFTPNTIITENLQIIRDFLPKNIQKLS